MRTALLIVIAGCGSTPLLTFTDGVNRERAHVALVHAQETDARLIDNRRPYGYWAPTFALEPGTYTFEIRRYTRTSMTGMVIVTSGRRVVATTTYTIQDIEQWKVPKTIRVTVKAGHEYVIDTDPVGPEGAPTSWTFRVIDVTEDETLQKSGG